MKKLSLWAILLLSVSNIFAINELGGLVDRTSGKAVYDARAVFPTFSSISNTIMHFGFLTNESDTIQSVINRGSTATNESFTIGSLRFWETASKRAALTGTNSSGAIILTTLANSAFTTDAASISLGAVAIQLSYGTNESGSIRLGYGGSAPTFSQSGFTMGGGTIYNADISSIESDPVAIIVATNAQYLANILWTNAAFAQYAVIANTASNLSVGDHSFTGNIHVAGSVYVSDTIYVTNIFQTNLAIVVTNLTVDGETLLSKASTTYNATGGYNVVNYYTLTNVLTTNAIGISVTNSQYLVNILWTNTASATQGLYAATAYAWGNHSTNGYITNGQANVVFGTNLIISTGTITNKASISNDIVNYMTATNLIATLSPAPNLSNYITNYQPNVALGTNLTVGGAIPLTTNNMVSITNTYFNNAFLKASVGTATNFYWGSENLISGAGYMYMTENGQTSILYHVTSLSHTNKIGEFFSNP